MPLSSARIASTGSQQNCLELVAKVFDGRQTVSLSEAERNATIGYLQIGPSAVTQASLRAISK